ncbi:hypothetical protein IWQ56_004364 [Coemansia nantahalensis]|uniref:Uncharacterized protein n=1 Tax=Coemansia nantahalensis TaxID=2789366 RepID=A0ACC1JUN8_9FUNG|nr:hypothetical protein IWQ56_004364 [Coemansia nantahalensis]KAJ2767444.1 hypothetical protein IWQ57_003945 [Coemansia nantahalensis]
MHASASSEPLLGSGPCATTRDPSMTDGSATAAESTTSSVRRPPTGMRAAADLCAQLDEANGRRLDRQCAQLQHRRTEELGDILQRAGRLNAQRLTNQDYTPAAVRRIESLERVAERLDDPPDAGLAPRGDADPQHRTHEAFLHDVAARLRHIDGSAELPPPGQRAEHPRDHMRRFLLRSIERLHSLAPPAMETRQRFCRELVHGRQGGAASAGPTVASKP